MTSIIPRLWSSQITCKINHPPSNDCKTLYISLNRNSYLYFKLEEIFDFFSIQQNQIPYAWFEDSHSGRILDWNLPLDASANLFQHENTYFELTLKISMLTPSSLSTGSQSQSILAYQHNFQSKQQPLFTDISAFLEKYWRNIIKESCYILNNSSNLIMSMSLQNSIDFWNSVKTYNYIQYEKNFNKYNKFNPSNIPIKLYFINNLTVSFIYQPNLHKLFTKNLHDITLGTLVDTVLSLKSNKPSHITCITHGIELPLDSPIDELYSLMKHFDSFLHIIIKL